MESYSIKELLSGWIQPKGESDDLVEWYRLLSKVKFINRNISEENFGIMYKEYMNKFYLINFDINITQELSKITDIYHISVIKGYLLYLMYYICESKAESLPSNKYLKKILFYDINFLLRLSNIHGITIANKLVKVLTGETPEFKHINYNKVLQYQYDDMDVTKHSYNNKYYTINLPFTGTIPENVNMLRIDLESNETEYDI